jgi:hypothetical protein
MLRFVFILPLALLSACATVMSGTTQNVTVSTTPPAASCTLDRVGARVGAVPLTPGSVRLDKSKDDLSVSCSKDGYLTATIAHSSHFNGATFGNILLGGVVGVLVDASSGANFNYPEDLRIELAASPAPSLPPMAAQEPAPVVETPVRVRAPAARSSARPALAQRISAAASARGTDTAVVR